MKEGDQDRAAPPLARAGYPAIRLCKTGFFAYI